MDKLHILIIITNTCWKIYHKYVHIVIPKRITGSNFQHMKLHSKLQRVHIIKVRKDRVQFTSMHQHEGAEYIFNNYVFQTWKYLHIMDKLIPSCNAFIKTM